MTWRWSDEARLMVRPFVTYRALAARPPVVGWASLRAPGLLMLSVACFISWTSSGKLLLDHLLLAPLSWSFLPVLQVVMVLLTARAAGSKRAPASLIDLYFRGHMPWMIVITLASALCLLPSGTWHAYRWLLGSYVLVAVMLVAIAWCALLSYAFFRAALGLSHLRSAITCGAFYLGVIGLGVGYYAITNQVQPLLGVMP